ncbi:MAG: PssD/Cps14F family polysaccharide biosynthesis glycosyltransferase [Candidatus Aenigmatarchaeota archaeon]
MKKINIGFICSGGGHLTEILELLEVAKDTKRFLVTNEGKHNIVNYSLFDKEYKIKPLKIDFNIIFQLLKIFKILLKEKPDFIISTGAEIAIPFFYLSKFLFKTKLIYLESSAQVYKPSRTGKIVYPITDLFLVQWKNLLNKYGKKAKYVGGLI